MGPVCLDRVRLEPFCLDPVCLSVWTLDPVCLDSVRLDPLRLDPVCLDPVCLYLSGPGPAPRCTEVLLSSTAIVCRAIGRVAALYTVHQIIPLKGLYSPFKGYMLKV